MRRAFVLMALLLLLGCGAPPKPPAQLHGIYLSAESLGAVSLKLPENWEMREGLERVPLVAMSPVRQGQTFRESLTLVAVPLQAGETAEQLIARSLSEATQQLKNVQRLPSPDPSRWASYTHDYGGHSIQVMAYFLVRDQTGYIFAFSAAPADMAQALPLFQAIARTISVDPDDYARMKELREAMQKHDTVVWEIQNGIRK